jgi:hypothetical protein
LRPASGFACEKYKNYEVICPLDLTFGIIDRGKGKGTVLSTITSSTKQEDGKQ